MWRTPLLTIGGIAIPGTGFRWALQSGVLPYMTSQIVPKGAINDFLSQIQNPTTIRLEATGGTTGQPDLFVKEFNGIYLVEPKAIDDWHVSWTIADARWAWRGKKMYYSYNKTRVKNAFVSGISAGETDPVILRQPYDLFGTGRYLPWSIKGSEKPYNMREILEIELGKAGILFDSNQFVDQGAYVIENIEGNGIDIYSGLANLLARSRLNLGIRENGHVYVFSLDYFDTNQIDAVYLQQASQKTKPGTLYKQDLKRIRPNRVVVKFERKVETRVISTDRDDTLGPKLIPYTNPPVWNQIDIDERRIIGCENVLPIPYPITIDGVERQIGEWIPLKRYISAITPPILDSDIRTYYFYNGDRLKRRYAKLIEIATGSPPSQANEQYASHIVGTIISHYRRTYKIDPYWVDRMLSWDARRVSVIDNYSHYSPVSPLWIDYCAIPTMRHPALAKRTALWDEHATNWIVSQRDASREKPSPGSISIVNQPLGIFQISFPPMIDMIFKQIIPSALDPIPYPSLTKAAYSLEKCSLISAHTMEALISVVWAVDRYDDFAGNSGKKYWSIPLDFGNLGGVGPEIEYLSNSEWARMPIREIKNEAPINNQEKPINEGTLDALAKVEAGKLINALKDRTSGVVTLAGYVPVALTGNIKAVIISFTGAGLETTLDLMEIPPAPTLEQALPQSMIDYLYRHVSRADEKAEMK